MRTRQTIIALVAIAALILTVITVVRRNGGPAPVLPGAGVTAVSLTPAAHDPAGLDPAGVLNLAASRPLTLAVVKEGLSVEPAVDLRVEPADQEGTRFAVTPARALEPNRIYRFRLSAEAGLDRDYHWSFQTRAEFRLLGTLPAHQSTGVPVNTGIEFSFSHDDYADPAAYFSIIPEVQGRFERHKRTAVFVPADPLEPGTIYTVTLKEGLGRTRGEGRLAEAHTFEFETALLEATNPKEAFHLYSEAAEFPADTAPFFRIWSTAQSQAQLEVAAHRYPDAGAFIAAVRKVDELPPWSIAAQEQYWEPTEGLTPVASFTAQAQSAENGNYLVFPEPLPPGYYLASVQMGQHLRQIRFQVTDLSYYLVETRTGGLAWLNDLATGRPAAGAEISLADGSSMVTTDEDGVALLALQGEADSDAERPLAFWIARFGGKEAVLYSTPRPYWYGSGEQESQLYWRYLYLDRPLYKPADTVHLWGVLHPREREAQPVGEVRVEVTRSDYWRADGGPIPLVGATLPVQDSTFTGSLDLPNLSPGYYQVNLYVGEQVFNSQWFEVATYAKPAYQIEVAADREAMFSGETVNFRVKATFFEGTPVPNMTLNYRINWGAEGGSVTTDEHGEAVIAYTPPHQEKMWGSEDRLYLSVTGGEPEVGEVAAERHLRLFGRDVMAQSRTSQTGSEATVTVQLNRVVLDQVNAGTGREVTGPAVAAQPVEFTLIEQNWNRIETGQYYDFIEKVVRKEYRYEPAHIMIDRATVTTGADGQAVYAFALDPEKQYEVQYRLKDSRGLWLDGSTHVSGRRFIHPEHSVWGWTQLQPADPEQYRFGIGEPVDFLMRKGETQLADRPNGFLFFTARRGLQDHEVCDTPTYTLTLQDGDPPSISLTGIAFDGRRYLTAERTVWFEPESRRLELTATPDKAAYRPGDEVRVQVAVQDAEGRPAAGAVVNLNLVDEALYALQEQEVDLLGSLYGDLVSSGIVRSRSSHAEPEMGGGAEKGGDGGGTRRDFKDAVLFTSVTTDAAGRATATFRVPDNLTSWRLTYQAFRPSTVEAGSGSVSIPVKLPFFADLVMGETFLVGERPVFQVRAYGSALGPHSEMVAYRVEVEGPKGHRQELELTGEPFAPVSMPLGELKAEGEYRVRVAATAGGDLSDALERTFQVLETHLVQNRVDFTPLEPGVQLAGADEGLTYVTFLDWERGRYLDLLQRMRWQWGNRFEMKLARAIAGDLLRIHFDWKDPWPEPELEAFRHQTLDGSIAILPYSDGDLKLSALAADLAPERFDQAALTLYFQRVLDDEGESRERQILALYGLAALNEPVLIRAQSLLTEPDLTPTEQLYLLLGLAELGDLESVRQPYQSILAAYGQEVGRDLRLTAGGDRDEQLQATALAAALAGKLGVTETPRMVSYLAENQPEDSLVQLELLLAAQSGLAGLTGEPVAFTYRLGGQAVVKELQPGERHELALRPGEMASLSIGEVRGSVAAVVTYTRAAKPAVEMTGGSVARSYSPAPETWRPGDIVTVTVTYSLPADAPAGEYELTDALPSGLRYLERPWAYGVQMSWSNYDSWPLQVDGQRVTFWAGTNGRPIRYRARVVSAGEYRVEEAVIRHQKSGLVYGMSSPEAVTIEW